MNTERRSALILLAAIALALGPHLWMQPPWFGGLLALLLTLRAVQVYRSIRPLPRWLLIILAFALVALTFRAHHTLVGRDGGIALLACLIIAKLFESRGRRDSNILIMLVYFCTVAFFLISQSPGMTALALGSCVLITTAGLTQDRPHDALPQSGRLAGRMVLEAIPLAILLFVFFPRLPGPLWHMPSERISRSGLSSEAMEPGNVSQLALDDSIAFRVEFAGALPPPQALYWRGPIFETFDDRRWLPAGRSGQPPQITALGPSTRYTITLEPHQQRWLLALDLPTELPSGATLGNRMQVLASELVNQRQRYTLESTLVWQTSSDASLRFARQLPRGGNPRARELAASWLALPPAQRVQAGLDYLRTHDFGYTLEPPLLNSPNVIDEFLFDSKLGFCEHFSSSFTYLMRAAGVPARIVTGYQGGNFNTAGGYLIVRQADAHAWVEVWLEDRGWQRVDPTAVVAPARIQSGLARSIPQSNTLPMMLRNQDSWLKSFRLRLDVLSNGWNQWVIGYNVQQQMAFLQKLGISDYLSPAYLVWLLSGFGLILGGFACWTLWPTRAARLDPASRLYRRFCRKLARKELIRGAQEGPQNFARRAVQALPQVSSDIEQITRLYLAVRYGDHTGSMRELRERITRFQP